MITRPCTAGQYCAGWPGSSEYVQAGIETFYKKLLRNKMATQFLAFRKLNGTQNN
jgi:hypothetical protein